LPIFRFVLQEDSMSQVQLTPEQEAEARELEAKVQAAMQADIRLMCRQMVSRKDHELLGENEFVMRDIGHKMAATVVQEGVNQRSKKGVPR
jgi:hypothetical protein